MAKKENELTYLQSPLPKGRERGKMTKLDWSGLNYRNIKDTGEISKELNISTHFAPFLSPSEVKKQITSGLFDNYYDNSGTSPRIKEWEETPGISPSDIYYLEGYYIVQGYYEENKTTSSSSSGESTELKQKCIYQVCDKEFQLVQSVIIDDVPAKESGAGVVGFRYFENFKNVADISTGTKILYFPRGRGKLKGADEEQDISYSQAIPKVITLKRHFHEMENNEVRRTAVGEYIANNCIAKGGYYLLECATDKDENGNYLYPGGTGDSEDGNDVRQHSSKNSLVAYTNSPRGGQLTRYYFNIKQPYCIKDESGYGWYGLRNAEHAMVGTADMILMSPDIRYACIAHQRLFGINDSQVFASGYNNYANWDLDTADSYSAENAWMSSTQSSDGGRNVGIIAYGGSVFVFKEESTLEIVNTKNPFRINEIFSVGAIDQKGIQVVGNYLIFVSPDGVKLYNGTSLKDIGYNLNIEKVNSVVTGTDGRKFYMSAEINDEGRKRLFVYDSLTGLWAEEDVGTETITVPGENEGDTFEITQQIEFVGFTKSDDGFYGLTTSGKVFRLDTKDYNHEWYIETDFFTNNSVDIKHIQKVQMLCDIAPGSSIKAYILYDDEKFNPESSHKIFERQNTTEKEIKIPIRVIPRRTANYGFRIRIEGKGFSKLYQMEVGITGGGDKNISG